MIIVSSKILKCHLLLSDALMTTNWHRNCTLFTDMMEIEYTGLVWHIHTCMR